MLTIIIIIIKITTASYHWVQSMHQVAYSFLNSVKSLLISRATTEKSAFYFSDTQFWFSGTMPSYYMTFLWRRRRSKVHSSLIFLYFLIITIITARSRVKTYAGCTGAAPNALFKTCWLFLAAEQWSAAGDSQLLHLKYGTVFRKKSETIKLKALLKSTSKLIYSTRTWTSQPLMRLRLWF